MTDPARAEQHAREILPLVFAGLRAEEVKAELQISAKERIELHSIWTAEEIEQEATHRALVAKHFEVLLASPEVMAEVAQRREAAILSNGMRSTKEREYKLRHAQNESQEFDDDLEGA